MNRSTALCLIAALTVFSPLTATAGTTPPRTTRTLAPLPPAPATSPDPVTAVGATTSVTISWTAVPGATGYRVQRLSAAGLWDLVAKVANTVTTYKNSGLTSGTPYAYRVLALNTGGDGPPSATVTATPLAVPAPFTATAGDTQVTLAWGMSLGATGYTVYRGTSSLLTSMVAIAEGLPALTLVDSGLTNGTTYYYRIKATTTNSTSPVSSVVYAKPLPPPPATAPADLTATPGNAFVTLAWSAIDGVTGYKIYRSTTGVFENTPFTSVKTLTFKNTGLTNGTTYFYKVAAYGQGGIGPHTDPVSATPTAPPPAPTGLTATAGDGVVTLNWNAVPEATSYNVYRGTASRKESSIPIATGLTAPTFTNSNLENGPTYFYQVTAVNAGGQSPRSAEVFANPEQPQPPVDPETVSAFQFLRQVTWGPKPGDVDAVKAMGKEAFLSAQLAAAPSTYPDSLFTMSTEAAQEHFMSLALSGPDQLRQRMAWALHKIWVVSAVEIPSATGIVTYHRLLLNNAFGNYRDLMRDITLNPAMGRYLNMLNNRSQAITGTPPNENYARELMQLFTLGLTQLNPDGTPQTAGGSPIPTYTEQDVKELARILTGWTFGDGNPATAPRRLANENYGVPMEAVERYHDTGAKTFLGREFGAGQTAQQDLDQALDVIFAHGNVAPFISRQLIQQFVTSNPSPAYVAAVASVFSASGGNLASVVSAILTNPEAGISTATNGKLAEPVIFVVSMLRALNAAVTDHPFMSDKAESMGQKVFYPPSVFSYFSPGYRVRGTRGPTGAPLGGPEFQGLTTVTALERANFVGALLGGYFGADVTWDRTPFTTRAGDASALVDYCSLVFMAGRMSPEERAAIIEAVRVSPRTSPNERVRTALYLTLTAAQSQVDR